MSCEESYLAIIRYLTDEREPYAPGTQGNTKRKIRKAATCYVVRHGTLYYQRRQKGHNEFTELEVVLQDGRRKELIDQSHITGGGEHLHQQLTWESISQKYWWRGILKNVKDHIRECGQCQSRRITDDGSGPRPTRQGRRKVVVHVNDEDEDEEEEEEEGDEELDLIGSSCQPRSKVAKVVAKHELVFVDSKGEVNQFMSKHSQTMLDKLNQQRLVNQFCDITLLIEEEEHRAHKAVLAACSEYFHELFVEKGAVSTHEAVVDLSGFTKASFMPLLDFAYTSSLTFNFCVMADIANLARHLLMTEVLQICESVHKQVEAQKLTVYQRGDTHMVVSGPSDDQQGFADDSDAYMVTIQRDGQAVVTHTTVTREALAGEHVALVPHVVEGEAGQTVAVERGETMTLISRSREDAEGEDTMTVVTHSGQAGASESLAVVSACLAMEQPQDGDSPVEEAEAFIINVDPDTVMPSELVQLAAVAADVLPVQEAEAFIINVDPVMPSELVQLAAVAADVIPVQEVAAVSPRETRSEAVVESAPPQPHDLPVLPQKRKRGRPAKVKKETVEEEVTPVVEEEEEEEEVVEVVPQPLLTDVEESLEDGQEDRGNDRYKRRLRQPTMGKGGYARLHLGLEEEEEDKEELTTLKVGPRPGKRGRPPKRPVEGQVESQVEAEVDAEPKAEAESEALQEDAGTKEAEVEAGSKAGPALADSAVDGEHTCSECGMTFQRRYALIMHTLKHEKARGYKCSLCSKEFQYAASLRAHLARHKQQSSQRAPGPVATPPSAHSEGGVLGTRVAARTKREFVCDICGKTMPKLYSLRIHMLNHTGVRPHACKVCGKTFAHKHSLKLHKALHDESKHFQCTYCTKTFVSKRSMEEHTSLHTGESKYLCNTCGTTFHRASALSKHLKKHLRRPDVRPFACSECEKTFCEAKDLQQHMNKHMGLKPFQCQVCGKAYSWKKDWYSHVKSHSVAEPYKCNVCGKEFFEKALFRRHVKKATHGKKGRVKQNLERECEHCGRKFTQLREYRRHMNNHQGVKPFECLTCGVAWADARSLKRHVRTHTGERPYICPMCHDAHIDARTLRKHISRYHGDQLPGKIMLEKDTLQFHNQGTQVEHAVSILASDLPPELRPAQPLLSEEIETVLITEETVEAVQAADVVATLSDQSIMQVVNYVLAQQAVLPTGEDKLDDDDAPEVIQTMEVEVAHTAEVE